MNFIAHFLKNGLKGNDVFNMYSTDNEGKSVVAEKFIRTLKDKIFKRRTAESKINYSAVLDDIVDKYNNIGLLNQTYRC